MLFSAFAQTDSKDMETILNKLDKLEALKLENDTVSSLDLLKQETTVSKVPEVTQETPITADTIELLAEITFDTLTLELGSINQGQIVQKKFSFTNTGTDDLEIISVVPDCSCTSSEWTQVLIKPGQKGFVSVEYDSHDDIGKFLKTITVLHTAGDGYTFLEMTGFVAPKL
jgi:hypothetical protein